MTNQINPTGRFNVGQEIYVVATTINGRNTINTTLGIVHGDQPTLHFKKLTVSEHHKVSDQHSYTESLDYDGYILTDGEDIYFNQYPSAKYGQLNDSGDHLFRKQPCIAATSEQYREMYADQVNNPIFWNSVTSIFTDLDVSAYQVGSGAYVKVMSAKSRLLEAFEKAFPGKTIASLTKTIYGWEFTTSSVVVDK